MSPDFSQLPSALIDPAERHWQAYVEACERHQLEPLSAPEILGQLPRVWASSPFSARVCRQQPRALQELISDKRLQQADEPGALADRVQCELDACADENELKQRLRRIRNREMLRITWRDICGLATLEEVTRDLSDLADACLQYSIDWLREDLSARFGTPMDRAGNEAGFFVIAMGKLGAHELNFSSDIDLVFVFTEQGDTVGGKRSLSNPEYFGRLGKRLITCMSDITPDGFVFRVDMRLRPFGESGPLVVSEDAMLAYYEAHARDWERYALIKARVCAGSIEAGQSLLKALRPFVFRRYIDYSVMASLRDMKNMINRQVEQKGLQDDVKLGPGGIREIEFIGQVFQLIRGGREPALQIRRIQPVLQTLARLEVIASEEADELSEAYRFLRTTEHRLQQIEDQQTQLLPGDEEDRLRVALGMDYPDWPSFRTALDQQRDRVREHFSDLLRPPEDQCCEEDNDAAMTALWDHPDEDDLPALAAAGYQNPEQTLQQVLRLKDSHAVRHMGPEGQQRLQVLMPALLERACDYPVPDVTLERSLKLIEAIARRSVYLTLLIENPMALSNLLRLMSASNFVAEQLTRAPVLLDELLDPRNLYTPPEPDDLKQDLDRRLRKCVRGDLEQYMDVLRQFKNAQVLHVAAADIAGNLPLPEVSNHLSAIAETVVSSALTLAWLHLTGRHGEPWCEDESGERAAGFCIVAYGKLGGLELGYSSDLDIIFLHDSRGSKQQTRGDRPVENAVFFTRLAQRLIHMLSTNTPSGMAYETDTRLRPNGASGLIVTSLDAFEQYQRDKAWTWEHQALVRARCVAGTGQTGAGFDRIRCEILQQDRDDDSLRRDILEMREKMRSSLNRSDDQQFDLKQGLGGITDLEFMVQYAVLRWSTEHPALLRFTDNKRLLETMTEIGLIEPDVCEELKQAYFTLRGEIHHLALQGQKGLAPVGAFEQYHESIHRHWLDFVETC